MCNASCHFCSAPFRDDRIYSDFGSEKEEILKYVFANDFKGISFSGGDPFLVFDRMTDWLTYFKKNLPDYFYWVYTNGLAADNQKLRKLASAGIDEIRFNIAASGYISDKVLGSIREARKHFRLVTVEVPSIKKDSELLKAAMEMLEYAGIDYLNLHDYILTESDHCNEFEDFNTCILNKIMPIKYSASSIYNTEDIIRTARDRGYHFHINYCDMSKKQAQMKQRRLKMGRIFADKDFDVSLENGIIVNYYVAPDNIGEVELLKKSGDRMFLDNLRDRLLKKSELTTLLSAGKKILKVFYIPKMNVVQGKIPIKAEIISET
jgi:uncharacterized protein